MDLNSLLGVDDEGFVIAHMTGVELPVEESAGVSPARALELLREEKAGGDVFTETELARARAETEEQGFATGGVVTSERVFTVGEVPCEVTMPKDNVIFAGDVFRRPESYPDGNPKTAAGAKKPDLTVIPPTALLHLATAMMNGEQKYGLYNWRNIPISSRPYIAAALRHLLAYLDGEEFSADTTEQGKPVHHLAHVMATCAIVLDAKECGILNDNRGTSGPSGEMIERYNRDGTFNAA